MRGTGRPIFVGNRIDEFQVEILGVLDNIGPKESIILARLSGGPLEQTGVMQGMSGSPVYIDGKLVGAVALGFAYSKEPIAGIRPIEDMIRPASTRAAAPARRPPIALADSGFTRATLDAFAPQLRALGLEPLQVMSSGGKLDSAMGNPANLKPGAMICVELLRSEERRV